MSTDLIRYDLLAQEALRGVVRRVLEDVVKSGMPGDHHFYISFRTDAPGVRLSPRLREKYPEEMTVILQHQFWDLTVTEHAFEVGLSFGGVAEKLHVPYDTITGFFDPSVKFGLKFEAIESAKAAEPEPQIPALREVPRGAGSEPDETDPKKGQGDGDDEDDGSGGAQVLSFDKFRKK